MEEKTFRICMTVPLGKRNGVMYLQKKNSSVFGWMDLMNHKNSFTGKFLDQKKIEITGTFKTLVSTVEYIGTGIITEHTVSLKLKTSSNDHYFVYGEEKCNS